MPTFTDAKDLLAHQQRQLKQAVTAAQKAHEQAVKSTADYAKSLLSGTPIKRTPQQRKVLFQRLPRAFPIGYRSGALANSLRIVTEKSGGKTSAFITFSDKAAPFVLSPTGTARMAGTPFWNEVNKYYVARNLELQLQARERAGKG